jgi:rare lipoprotein A
MKLLFLVILGFLSASCQSTHKQPSDEHTLQENKFSITHEVTPKEFDYVSFKQKSIARKNPQPQPHFRKMSSGQDGAPKGSLPTWFQKIIPKREPISRYGNPDTYRVMGKKYDVMTNSTGYKNRGIASWYGTKFHKGRTSSGEKYDMYALTAAHKTLPLPTYVKVTNLSNGHVAIVKVNDRGPFHDDRIIDLSYAAAAKLGLLPKGTAPVEIEALKTTQRNLNYYVQAGAFDSGILAENLRAQLKNLTTSPVNIKRHEQKYIVQVGPFANKEMVNNLKQHLESHNIHGTFSMLM